MNCVALSVPVTIAWFLLPLIIEISSNGAIPMWFKAAINVGISVVVLVFVSVAGSAIVPWHRTRLARLAPWTLWGIAARLGIGSLSRSIRSLEDDLAAAVGEHPGDQLASTAR